VLGKAYGDKEYPNFENHPGWWFGKCFIFPYIGNFIIPTDELHHFSEGVGIPWYTTNQHPYVSSQLMGVIVPCFSVQLHLPTARRKIQNVVVQKAVPLRLLPSGRFAHLLHRRSFLN
jgi:hypothetical protein